jgi:uncharacterized protein YqgV (UPF0045/DUF77 family)
MTKYFCIEIPCRPDGTIRPEVSLAIAEISQYATKKLQKVGVEPMKTVFKAVEDGATL